VKPLLLIGGGGHFHACIDVIESVQKYRIAGIVLPTRGDHSDVMGYPVIGADEDLPALLAKTPNAIVTVGQIKSAALRMKLFELLKTHGANLPIIQSPFSYCSKHAVIGEGTILMHGSLVNVGVLVGANCIINSQALIEHDVEIADHCHISTGAKVNGSVRIGKGSFIGSGSIVKEGVKIGAEVVIGAGQLILKDVPDGMTIKAQHVK
jgi:sugar O-acyltransferase (sialic acid O-acetyltransferase NeuD family)